MLLNTHRHISWIFRIVLSVLLAGGTWMMNMTAHAAPAADLTPAEARAIAKEATVYGFPLVDHYRIQHAYFVNRNSPEFKAPWNEIHSDARVYTPEDKAIHTPNSDTPYSQLGADLRTEPLVLTMPGVEKGRYFSAQFVDAYTFNFAYVGSRTTGNDGGKFLLAGPGWKGQVPPGIQAVIRSETDFAFVFYRTQLFGPDDIENVKKVQAGYKVQPLSAYLNQSPPQPAPAIDFRQPLTPQQERTSLEFFDVLNFVLGFCPTHPSERALMTRFARIGIGAGERFDVQALKPEIRQAVQDGMADAWLAVEALTQQAISGRLSSGDLTGSRDYLKDNYLYRMRAAVSGIYGNSKEEALYPAYYADDTGQRLDGSRHRYILRFAPDQLPPVNSFWSLTMYELPSRLLVANPIHRYLINASMLSDMKRDADGGLTIHVQHESPDKNKESNWLPAPAGPLMIAMRLYWPKEEALSGRWKAPPMKRVE